MNEQRKQIEEYEQDIKDNIKHIVLQLEEVNLSVNTNNYQNKQIIRQEKKQNREQEI